jgi:outer membrane protein OmpU
MKKLLATTALVGLVASSAAIAETKVSGSIEATYNSVSVGGTGATGSGSLGNEVNLKISNTTELDNGLKANGHINFEDKGTRAAGGTAFDSQEIGLSSGNFKFYVGTDTGQHINSNINPRVDDQPADVVGDEIGDDAFNRYDVHDVNHVGVEVGTDYGKFAVMYAPSNSGSDVTSSATTDADGSATEINFKGSLGVEGLTVSLGQAKVNSKDGASSTAGELDEKETYYGASYKYGQFAIGAGKRTHDDGNGTATNSEDNQLAYSVTYAVNDQISVGYEVVETEKELVNASNPKEEAKAFTIGYDLGGMGVSFMWTEIDNMGSSNDAANDVESFQIRTVYKF